MLNRTDTHAYKVKESNVTIHDLHVDGTGYAEAIKISNLHDVTFRNSSAIGGWEDCVDCVRGSNYFFDSCKFIANKETRVFVTAKGGISGFTLRDCRLVGKCRWPWDISLGDHTIYNDRGDMTPMKDVVIDNVRRDDGKRVWILNLLGHKPILRNGKYFLINPPIFLVKIWFRVLKFFSKRS